MASRSCQRYSSRAWRPRRVPLTRLGTQTYTSVLNRPRTNHCKGERHTVESAPTTVQSLVLLQNGLQYIPDLYSRFRNHDRHCVLPCDKQYRVPEVDVPKLMAFQYPCSCCRRAHGNLYGSFSFQK